MRGGTGPRPIHTHSLLTPLGTSLLHIALSLSPPHRTSGSGDYFTVCDEDEDDATHARRVKAIKEAWTASGSDEDDNEDSDDYDSDSDDPDHYMRRYYGHRDATSSAGYYCTHTNRWVPGKALNIPNNNAALPITQRRGYHSSTFYNRIGSWGDLKAQKRLDDLQEAKAGSGMAEAWRTIRASIEEEEEDTEREALKDGELADKEADKEAAGSDGEWPEYALLDDDEIYHEASAGEEEGRDGGAMDYEDTYEALIDEATLSAHDNKESSKGDRPVHYMAESDSD